MAGVVNKVQELQIIKDDSHSHDVDEVCAGGMIMNEQGLKYVTGLDKGIARRNMVGIVFFE